MAGGWCPAASTSRLSALRLLSCAAIARLAVYDALSRVGLAPLPRFPARHLLAGVRATPQPITRFERSPRVRDQPDLRGQREHRRDERGVAAMPAGTSPPQPPEKGP